ncbi:Uncharacterized protein GBIM_01729 [Gryllus bimaculatus]|nr:Uncharacterized protein GBIM_01729 [Gryllus bimaculatus]
MYTLDGYCVEHANTSLSTGLVLGVHAFICMRTHRMGECFHSLTFSFTLVHPLERAPYWERCARAQEEQLELQLVYPLRTLILDPVTSSQCFHSLKLSFALVHPLERAPYWERWARAQEEKLELQLVYPLRILILDPVMSVLDFFPVLPFLDALFHPRPPLGASAMLGEVGAWARAQEEQLELQLVYPLRTTGLLLSAAALALTVATYALLPALRNLHGKTVMAHAGSQLVAFVMTLQAQESRLHSPLLAVDELLLAQRAVLRHLVDVWDNKKEKENPGSAVSQADAKSTTFKTNRPLMEMQNAGSILEAVEGIGPQTQKLQVERAEYRTLAAEYRAPAHNSMIQELYNT